MEILLKKMGLCKNIAGFSRGSVMSCCFESAIWVSSRVCFERDLFLPQVEGEVRQQQMGVTEQEQVLRVKGRTVELLPDAENNMAKLQVTTGGGEVIEELD